jgi:putative PIN family toxin of toxin-antitoxin system
MIVVIDTNVFVSSFFGGNPKKVIDLWKTGQVKLALTNEILEEYIKVLERMGLKDQETKRELLTLFRGSYSIVFSAKTQKIRMVEDPDDDKFLECAIALNADFIVSGDRHLLELGDYMGIKILNPRDFLHVIESRRV